MVGEGFELLGAFNFSDYLPWLSYFDPCRIVARCEALVPRVKKLVSGIIEQHKLKKKYENVSESADFVDVLLSLDVDEKLDENDMVVGLWEMIFRGTDTTALLTEWVMAELVLHPEVQAKLRDELDNSAGAELAALPYLQAVVKETLRIHPPGPCCPGPASPLRMSTSAMGWWSPLPPQPWSTCGPSPTTRRCGLTCWSSGLRGSSIIPSMGGADVDVRSGDVRLASFGAGRRVCPGRNLAMAMVALWVVELVRGFKWVSAEG